MISNTSWFRTFLNETNQGGDVYRNRSSSEWTSISLIMFTEIKSLRNKNFSLYDKPNTNIRLPYRHSLQCYLSNTFNSLTYETFIGQNQWLFLRQFFYAENNCFISLRKNGPFSKFHSKIPFQFILAWFFNMLLSFRYNSILNNDSQSYFETPYLYIFILLILYSRDVHPKSEAQPGGSGVRTLSKYWRLLILYI